MDNPVMAMASFRSLGMSDLRATLRELRALLSKLLRRACLRDVRVLVGNIEPKISLDRKHWTPHAHIVLDTATVDWKLIAAEWHALTGGRGTFEPHPHEPRVENPNAVARYITKDDDECPEPGKLTLPELKILVHACRGARLWIERGKTGWAV